MAELNSQDLYLPRGTKARIQGAPFDLDRFISADGQPLLDAEEVRRLPYPLVAAATAEALKPTLQIPAHELPEIVTNRLVGDPEACQTTSIANGVNHWLALQEKSWFPTPSTVKAIREQAAAKYEDTHLAFNPAAVAAFLEDWGLMIDDYAEATGNPVLAASWMANRGFAVLVTDEGNLATTVVPRFGGVSTSLSQAPGLMEISPYGHGRTDLTVDQFAQRVLSQDLSPDVGDMTLVCRVRQ